MDCACYGQLDVTRHLLDLGADPTLTDINGVTAFDIVKSDEMGTDPTLTDIDGETAFDMAKSDEIKSLLLQATEAFTPKKPTATLPPAPAPTTTRTPPADNGFTGPVFLVEKNPKPCDTCGLMEVVGENLFPICPICKVSKYCGRECQKADWKRHKGAACSELKAAAGFFNRKKPRAAPPPAPGPGPTFTTTTEASPADTGATGRPPFVKSPKPCDICGLMEVVGGILFPSCPICMMTRYCGRECQEAAWKEHKKLCRVSI